jgi:hypothetical protein
MIGRLKPGITKAATEAALNPAFQRAAYDPLGGKPERGERPVRLELVEARGIVIGLAAAIASSRLLSSLLYGVPAANPLSLAVAICAVAAVALAATSIPARRAAAVDPLTALRQE